jgi:hypothetical protein
VGRQNGTASVGDIFHQNILTIGSSNYAPGIYTKGTEKLLFTHKKNCPWMLIAALFIIAKIWKQPRYPSAGDGHMVVHPDKRNVLSSHEKM